MYSLRKESLSPREQLCIGGLELDFGLGGGGGGTQLNAFGQKMCLRARGNKELGGGGGGGAVTTLCFSVTVFTELDSLC